MATLVARVAYGADAGGQSSSTTPKVAAAINAAFGRASCGVTNCYLFIGGDTYSPYATTTTMANYNSYLSLANIAPGRTIMIPGNHDNGPGGTQYPDNAAWKKYQTDKGTLTNVTGGTINATEGIPNTDQYIDIGGIRFICINSGAIITLNATPGWPVPHTGGSVANNARVNWLRNAWKPGVKNVVLTHHPRWSYYGKHHDNATMQNLIDEIMGKNDNTSPHACLLLQGHDHNMQIMQPQGATPTYAGLTNVIAGLCATAPDNAAGPSSQTSQKGWLQFANITAGAAGFFQIDIMSDGSMVGSMIDAANTNGTLLTNTASTNISGSASVTISTGTVAPTITYKYALDGGAQVDNGTSATVDLTHLAAGPHYMEIQKIDSVNGTSDKTSYAWVTPATRPNPPTVNAVNDPAGATVPNGGNTTSPTLIFQLSGDVSTTLKATVDGVDQGTIASPYSLDNIAVGNHTVSFYSINGGVSSLPTVFTFARKSPGGGPGSGVYTRTVTLPGGIPGSSVPAQIWVRATDTAGATTTVKRNVILALPPVFLPSLSIISPADGSTINTGLPTVTVDADSTIISVNLTLDGVTSYPMATVGSPVSGIQRWTGTIPVPSDGAVYVIQAIGSDGTNTGTDNASVMFGTIVIPPGGGGGPPPQIVAHPRVEFVVAHVDHQGNDIGSIIPSSLTGSIVLNDAGSISYVVPLASPFARKEMCDPDFFDWRLERNGTPIMGGILDEVSLDTTTRNMQISGKTWEAYLAQRVMPWNPLASDVNTFMKTYTSMDILDQMRRLFDYVFGVNNSIPLTFAATKSGIITTNTFDASALNDMLTIIQTYAQQTPGFDFDINYACQMNFYVPQKGGVSDLVLEQDVNVISVQYTDSGIKGNNVIGSCSTPTGASQYRNASDAASQKASRIIDDPADFGTVLSPAALQSITRTELAYATQKQREITVRVDPGGENYWLHATVGDKIKVRADTYYEKLDGYFRCTEIDFEQSDGGKEYLTYTFTPNTTGTD